MQPILRVAPTTDDVFEKPLENVRKKRAEAAKRQSGMVAAAS